MCLLLVCAGCASPGLEFRGDESFEPAERAAIERALDEMTGHLGLEKPPILWGGDGDGVRIIRRAPPLPGRGGQYDRDTFLFWSEERIYILPDLPDDLVRRVAMHEFGHAFGLPHHGGEGVMRDPAGDGWTEDDEASCRRAGVCR